MRLPRSDLPLARPRVDGLAVLRCLKAMRTFGLIRTFPRLRHGGFAKRGRPKNAPFGLVNPLACCRVRGFPELGRANRDSFRLIYAFPRFRHRGLAVLGALRVTLHAQNQGDT